MESEDEGGDGLLGRLRKIWPQQPETGGAGDWEGLPIRESSPQSLERV